MANSEMILRLLTDLKIEQQALKEQLEKIQTAVNTLEEKTAIVEEKPKIIKEKPMTIEEKTSCCCCKAKNSSWTPNIFSCLESSCSKKFIKL